MAKDVLVSALEEFDNKPYGGEKQRIIDILKELFPTKFLDQLETPEGVILAFIEAIHDDNLDKEIARRSTVVRKRENRITGEKRQGNRITGARRRGNRVKLKIYPLLAFQDNSLKIWENNAWMEIPIKDLVFPLILYNDNVKSANFLPKDPESEGEIKGDYIVHLPKINLVLDYHLWQHLRSFLIQKYKILVQKGELKHEKVFGEVHGIFRMTEKQFWFKLEGQEYSFPTDEILYFFTDNKQHYEKPKNSTFYFEIAEGKKIDLEKLQHNHAEINKAYLKFHEFKKKQRYIAIIKDLLSELNVGDEVKLEEAVKIVNEEAHIQYKAWIRGKDKAYYSRHPQRNIKIQDSFIENFFRLIGQKIPGFEYVRLKKVIRIKSDVSSSIGEIDQLFSDWEANPQKFKKI
ncbi:MAG: hypothetical protein ACTSRK_21270 [Promethearchaeota archaeon]